MERYRLAAEWEPVLSHHRARLQSIGRSLEVRPPGSRLCNSDVDSARFENRAGRKLKRWSSVRYESSTNRYKLKTGTAWCCPLVLGLSGISKRCCVVGYFGGRNPFLSNLGLGMPAGLLEMLACLLGNAC